jgi:hypothetical protein
LCASNAFTSLDLSNNTELKELGCWDNQITSLDLSACTALEHVIADATKITSLDISSNTSLSHLSLRFMEDLQKVCVWTTPFPDEGMQVITTFSPNIYFTTECSEEDAPSIMASDTVYQPDFIKATSTEDGKIYLVPESTQKAIATIRRACIDSVPALAQTPVEVPLSGLENGVYWLYVRDITGNLSEPEAFTVLGVGMETNRSENAKFYPNPATHFLTIETGISGLYHIRITTLNGFPVFSREMEGATHQIDLTSYRKGIYFISIRSKDYLTTRKIIKLE